MYNVLLTFADLHDDKFIYHSGENYPREGYTPESERIEELSGSENAFKAPIIAEIKSKGKKGV